MKRITKNEFIEKMRGSRVCLLTSKFQEEVDWDWYLQKTIDLDERLDETNVEYVNRNEFDWRTVIDVTSTYMLFSTGSRIYFEGCEYYNLLHGDYEIDYLAVRTKGGCTIIYAIEKLGD